MLGLRLSILLSVCLLWFSTHAAVKLPNIFNNDMVLQRDIQVPVWGWSDPGEQITVEFAGQKKQTVAKADGTWQLKLDALRASTYPAIFKVIASNTLELTNVVAGEVWFCSGQSNMEWTMNRNINNSTQEIANATFPLIRHFKAPKRFTSLPEKDVNAKWEITTPIVIADKSAVAFFFGRRLHQELKVPIGLINCSWGGTRIEPWTPACGFSNLPALADIKTRVDAAILKCQQDPTAPFGQGKQQDPTVLFNGMVAGLVPFAIRGAIWYQGCSNNGEGMLYLEKTKALVNGWRQVWGQGNFPYYLVQLAPYTYGSDPKNLPGIWEAQAAVPAAITNTGYTVINDIGLIKNIHPTNKQDVGLRMANQALNRTYGFTDIVWSGPILRSTTIKGATIRVLFDHADGLTTRDGQPPTWFELCGTDGVFVKANAKIDGQSVIVSAPSIAAPVALRFAWDQTAEPNLINRHGLPTGAFRFSIAPKFPTL